MLQFIELCEQGIDDLAGSGYGSYKADTHVHAMHPMVLAQRLLLPGQM